MNNSLKTLRLVWAALFTALIAAGSLLSFNLGGIPFVLANFFILLSGLILGPLGSGLSLFIYLILGVAGVPVFAGGSSGPGEFMGPTGGFLMGYLFCGIVAGLLRDKSGQSILKNSLAGFAGLVTLYLIGIPFMSMITKTSPIATLSLMSLFIVLDMIKAVLAAGLTKILFRTIPQLKK